MSQQAAKRRRSQAANGYRHMAPLRRPHYMKVSNEKSARRLAQRIAVERRMQNNKGKKK